MYWRLNRFNKFALRLENMFKEKYPGDYDVVERRIQEIVK